MNPAQFTLIALVRVYRWTVSPLQTLLFGPYTGCRFTPTCSQYAAEAVRTHGAVAGGWLATKRICRCQPWGGCGHDPVPRKVSSFEFVVSGHLAARPHETPTPKTEILLHGS